MARPDPTAAPDRPSRRLRSVALASCTALAMSTAALAGAAPASAQTSGTTTTSTSTAGAASASAVRLVLNLPQGNTIALDIDPVAGTVRAVPGSGPQANAVAAVLAGSVGGQSQSFGQATAKLPSPTSADGGPLAALNSGINASPLGAFIKLQAASSTASVTTAPNSTSQAGTTLGVGLPQALADALGQVFTPLITGLNDVLAGLAPTDPAVQQVCQGLTAVTNPAAGVAGTIPVLGPIVQDVNKGVTDPQTGALCTVRKTLGDIVTRLDAALKTLAGPGGLLNLGLLQASQNLTTAQGKVTSVATSQVGALTVLGTNPFGTAQVLRTASTATTAGTPGSATATVDEAAVTVSATPLALFKYDLTAVTGQLAGINLTGLNTLLSNVQALLDALAGVGVQGGRIGAPTDAISACPATVSTTLSGTFKAPDGTCAAAAARGYGLALTLPAALATPLGITGPLLSLTFTPSAAVATASVTTTTTPGTPGTPTTVAGRLAMTGLEGPLAAIGLLLVAVAAAVRRRRSVG